MVMDLSSIMDLFSSTTISSCTGDKVIYQKDSYPLTKCNPGFGWVNNITYGLIKDFNQPEMISDTVFTDGGSCIHLTSSSLLLEPNNIIIDCAGHVLNGTTEKQGKVSNNGIEFYYGAKDICNSNYCN